MHSNGFFTLLFVLSAVICTGQSVGINTTSPQRDLDVRGSVQIMGNSSGVSTAQLQLLDNGGTGNFTRQVFGNTASADYWMFAARPENTGVDRRFNIFNPTLGNVIIIDEMGKMGVRTNPTDRLQVASLTGENAFRVQVGNATKLRVFSNGSIALGTNNQNVSDDDVYIHQQLGIGVSSPTERLDINGAMISDQLYVREDLIVGGKDKTAQNDTLFFFDGQKGALRSGWISNASWQQDSIGEYSFAFGLNTKALGIYSIAGGVNSVAGNLGSVAFGNASKARGYAAFAANLQNSASGFASSTFGQASEANASSSMAIGRGVINNGNHSTVIGYFNDPVYTVDDNAFIPGNDLPLFIIGNGTMSNRSNALLVRYDGKVGIGIDAPKEALDVNGSIVPSTNTTHDMGKANYRWQNMYAENLSLEGTGTDITLVEVKNTNGVTGTSSGIELSSGVGRAQIRSAVTSSADGDHNIEFWVSNNEDFLKELTITKNLMIVNNIRPETDNTFDLGTSSQAMDDVWAYGYVTASDARKKARMSDLDYGLETLLMLQPKSYVYRGEEDRRLGLVAQEVQSIIPEVVDADDPDNLGIRYADLIPVLIKSVQELDQKNTALEAQNAALMERLDRLEKRISERN